MNDFRSGIGFGEMTGGGVDPPVLCCQRSSTELCLLPGESVLSGVGDPSGDVTSSDALFSTMFFTNPRPFNLLKLGVGSFGGGGLRNAGEGLCEGGIWGLPNEGRGLGWMGRARPGNGCPCIGERDGEGGGGVWNAAEGGRGAGDLDPDWGMPGALLVRGVMGRMIGFGERERGREIGSALGFVVNVSAGELNLAGAAPVGVLIVRCLIGIDEEPV